MHRYKYDASGRRYNPGTQKDPNSILGVCRFVVNFGDENMGKEVAILRADEIFQHELEMAQPGESILMTLWENSQIVKNYPDTVKE